MTKTMNKTVGNTAEKTMGKAVNQTIGKAVSRPMGKAEHLLAHGERPPLRLGGTIRFSKEGKYAFLFAVGGVGYGLVELLWRGRTHPSMVLTGGLCMTLVYGINGALSHRSLLLRSAASAAAITTTELGVGILVNRILKLDVWDYSDMHIQFMGQICLRYSIYWFLLSGILLFFLNIYKKRALK